MAMNIIDFGRTHKGETIGECPVSYLKWLASHEGRLALRNRWASRDSRFELERRGRAAAEAAVVASIEATVEAAMVPVVVEEPAPVIVERKKIFDAQLCCEVWSDTGERVVPQIFVEGLGWVTPPGTEEVLDVEDGLSWSYAVRRSNSKMRMKAEINAIKARKRSEDISQRGTFGSKPFSVLR